jgi:hypothetical protein
MLNDLHFRRLSVLYVRSVRDQVSNRYPRRNSLLSDLDNWSVIPSVYV